MLGMLGTQEKCYTKSRRRNPTSLGFTTCWEMYRNGLQMRLGPGVTNEPPLVAPIPANRFIVALDNMMDIAHIE